jgi:hypothetical protein
MSPADEELLVSTIERFVEPGVVLISIDELPIEQGYSGVRLRRMLVRVRSAAGGESSVPLVLKDCSILERRVLLRLQTLQPRHVPFAHSSGTADDDQPTTVCLQDLGDRYRPDSLSPIDPGLRRLEAEALADIHAANLRATDLDWLPATDRTYFDWAIERHFFRPAWDRAMADGRFAAEFGSLAADVESAAATIVDDMVRLADDDDLRTLVHTDINPSNVLVWQDAPYLIDWDTARLGTLFIDLPHHLSTREQAEDYRIALAERGTTIAPHAFTRGYATAARYTGLRYLWWTLDAWLADPSVEPWVRHYLTMVLGSRAAS